MRLLLQYCKKKLETYCCQLVENTWVGASYELNNVLDKNCCQGFKWSSMREGDCCCQDWRCVTIGVKTLGRRWSEKMACLH